MNDTYRWTMILQLFLFFGHLSIGNWPFVSLVLEVSAFHFYRFQRPKYEYHFHAVHLIQIMFKDACLFLHPSRLSNLTLNSIYNSQPIPHYHLFPIQIRIRLPMPTRMSALPLLRIPTKLPRLHFPITTRCCLDSL